MIRILQYVTKIRGMKATITRAEFNSLLVPRDFSGFAFLSSSFVSPLSNLPDISPPLLPSPPLFSLPLFWQKNPRQLEESILLFQSLLISLCCKKSSVPNRTIETTSNAKANKENSLRFCVPTSESI